MWRQAAFSAQQTLSRYGGVAGPMAIAMGTAVTVLPHSAITTTTTTRMEAASYSSYSRPFLPRDIYYDLPLRDALAKLRGMKRVEVREEHDDDDDNNRNSNEEVPPKDLGLKALESAGRKDSGTLTLIGYKGGPIGAQVNQDRAICVAPFVDLPGKKPKTKRSWWSRRKKNQKRIQEEKGGPLSDSRLIGVFDGHANLGERVSQHVVTELPKLLASKLAALQNATVEAVSDLLKETFIELDRTAPADISGGCTATVVLQYGPKIYFANCGDSRSFLVVYREKSQEVNLIYITREDKPSLPDERERVERMGGEVYIPAMGTSRVLYTDPETGVIAGLAMSRSIGDWDVAKLGVIPDPLVDVVDIPELVESERKRKGQPDDDVHVFVVSASDGMMDFVSPELVAQTVALSLYEADGPHLLTALEQLIYYAAQSWEQSKVGRYRDDIAIAVSQLRRPPRPPAQ